MNVEHCVKCDEATGRAGRGDDSLFDADGKGPYCDDCWDKTGEPMKKAIGGKVYVQVPEKELGSCDGCAAVGDDKLCSDLHRNVIRCGGKIWEEEKMKKQKTAVELVEEMIANWGGDNLRERMEQIKSAIEREQADAIQMRPISDLPDRVPEGYIIVAVNHRDSWVWLDVIPKSWTNCAANRELLPTCFYVIPKPVKERKLKACPYCQAIPVKLTNYWNIRHTDACPIQSACVIMFDKCDIWGWK
jgi:hypothetical protein